MAEKLEVTTEEASPLKTLHATGLFNVMMQESPSSEIVASPALTELGQRILDNAQLTP